MGERSDKPIERRVTGTTLANETAEGNSCVRALITKVVSYNLHLHQGIDVYIFNSYSVSSTGIDMRNVDLD